MLEAMELWVDTLVPAEMQTLFKEAKLMHKKWEAKRKVHKDDAA